jgi:hypothetical protein
MILSVSHIEREGKRRKRGASNDDDDDDDGVGSGAVNQTDERKKRKTRDALQQQTGGPGRFLCNLSCSWWLPRVVKKQI